VPHANHRRNVGHFDRWAPGYDRSWTGWTTQVARHLPHRTAASCRRCDRAQAARKTGV